MVLVGGATRVPAVRRFVQELFGQPPLCDLDPDQVVALGPRCRPISQNARTDALLIDVTPLSLGLELMGGVVEKIIPRNSRVPTGARQVFTTYADGQTGFDLHVVQGERETASECRSLARFKLTGIPRMAAGMARLEVSFLIDENGLLAVTARELTSGREAHTTVKPSYGLTDEQVEQMLLDSFEHGESDLRQRMLITQRVEADRILGALTVALARDGAILSDAERQRIDAARAAVEQAKAGNDHRRIAEAITALDLASKDFAQRRMDDSLSHAVSGRAVRDIEAAVEHAHGPEAAHAAVPSSPQAILPPSRASPPARTKKSVAACPRSPSSTTPAPKPTPTASRAPRASKCRSARRCSKPPRRSTPRSATPAAASAPARPATSTSSPASAPSHRRKTRKRTSWTRPSTSAPARACPARPASWQAPAKTSKSRSRARAAAPTSTNTRRRAAG